jgi:hypothetical protein
VLQVHHHSLEDPRNDASMPARWAYDCCGSEPAVATTAAKCSLDPRSLHFGAARRRTARIMAVGFVTSAFKGSPAVQTMRSVLPLMTRSRHSGRCIPASAKLVFQILFFRDRVSLEIAIPCA